MAIPSMSGKALDISTENLFPDIPLLDTLHVVLCRRDLLGDGELKRREMQGLPSQPESASLRANISVAHFPTEWTGHGVPYTYKRTMPAAQPDDPKPTSLRGFKQEPGTVTEGICGW